jgi:peroxiredoxin
MKKAILPLFIIFLSLGNIAEAQLPAASTEISPLLIGEIVPDAILTNTNGEQISIVEIIKDKPTVVIFYNGLWCYFCGVYFTNQIAPVANEITNLGYNMIAISPDIPDSLIGMSELAGLPAEMFYQDGEGTFSASMGIAYRPHEDFFARLESYSGGLNKGFLPVPGAFVINPDQSISFEYINPNGNNSDLRIRGDFLITVLQALKQENEE